MKKKQKTIVDNEDFEVDEKNYTISYTSSENFFFGRKKSRVGYVDLYAFRQLAVERRQYPGNQHCPGRLTHGAQLTFEQQVRKLSNDTIFLCSLSKQTTEKQSSSSQEPALKLLI